MLADVILAADILDLVKLTKLLELAIQGVKIGPTLALTYGLVKITDLIDEINPALSVIYDGYRLDHDSIKLFIEVIRITGIDEVILFPLSELKTLEEALKYCEEYKVKPWIGLNEEQDFFKATFDFVNSEFPDFNNFVTPCTGSYLLDSIIDPCEVLITGIKQEAKDISAINRLCLRINTEGSINVNVVLGSALYEASDPQKVLDNIKFL